MRIPAEARSAYIYVIGISGKGKSNLLEHYLYQDITAGCGCGLIDPHSLLADDLLRLLITRHVLDDPELQTETHPASHLHLLDEVCRWPVFGPICVGHFIRFIFRHFYPKIWSEFEKLRNWELQF
jgi:hypothetical protein